MALSLLDCHDATSTELRTIGHDLESFFMLMVALSFDREDKARGQTVANFLAPGSKNFAAEKRSSMCAFSRTVLDQLPEKYQYKEIKQCFATWLEIVYPKFGGLDGIGKEQDPTKLSANF
jgi:hypothetical protein